MILNGCILADKDGSIPRMSGDDPKETITVSKEKLYSPHERG